MNQGLMNMAMFSLHNQQLAGLSGALGQLGQNTASAFGLLEGNGPHYKSELQQMKDDVDALLKGWDKV